MPRTMYIGIIINMPCRICEQYHMHGKKSLCGCSYGAVQEKRKVEEKSDFNIPHCVICKIKVSGSLLDCSNQPICNGCNHCSIIFGVCLNCEK